jgi:Sigma-70, region 4/Putative zinc-finger
LEAIGTLTERQARILLLRDVCALEPADVCRQLRISRRTYRHDHALAINTVCARVQELLDGDWCAKHRELLSAYAERRATGAQVHAAQRHLRNCLACRRRVAAHRCGTGAALTDRVTAAT